MLLISLPDDVLRAIATALLAEYEDERGYVRFSPAACSQMCAISAVHPRLRAAVATALDSVAYEDEYPVLTGHTLAYSEEQSQRAMNTRQFASYSGLSHPTNAQIVPDEQGRLPVSFELAVDINALAANARRVALYTAPPRTFPSGLRELRIETLAITDSACAKLIAANASTLRRLTLVQCSFGPIAADVQCIALETLEMHRVAGVNPRTLRRMLTKSCTTLCDLDIDQPYPAAPHVADKCHSLVRLVLGRSDTVLQALERAVVASATSLEELILRGRRADGDAVLNEQSLQALLSRCIALRTLDVGPLAARFVAGTMNSTSIDFPRRRVRYTTLYIRSRTEWSLLVRANVRTPNLEWEHARASFDGAGALALVHCGLRSVVLRAIPGCTDAVLGIIGVRTGRLRRIRLEQLPDVTCAGIEALLRPNRKVHAFGVGAKCRKLSNVGIMRALARHARSLRVATFPRWSCAAAATPGPRTGRAASADPHLTAALEAFKAAVPHARIRSE